jgi:hypothetical protein
VRDGSSNNLDNTRNRMQNPKNKKKIKKDVYDFTTGNIGK